MRKSGQITVFLSLVFLCLCSLLCGLVESARTAGARCCLKLAADSAMDSVFSGYHREAWDQYRVFLLESKDEEAVLEDWRSFMEPYMESSGWYSLKIKGAGFTGFSRITDHGGEDLKQEILDYMRYGILEGISDGEGIAKLSAGLKEAEAVKEIVGSFCGHTKEAVRLERALDDITKSLKKDHDSLSNAFRRIKDYDGAGFRSELDCLEKELDRMTSLVKVYGKRADALKKKLEQTDSSRLKLQGDLSEGIRQAVEEDTSCYRSYTEEAGEKRKEIEALPEKLQGLKTILDRARERSIEVEDIIDNWSADDDDDDGPDLSGLWGSVGGILDYVKLPALPYLAGVKDEEQERLLEQVEGFAQTGLLFLVLPKGREVSKGVLNQQDFPSLLYENNGTSETTLLDRMIVNEYCGRFFTSFASLEDKEVKYELEYLTAGKNTDEENLKQAVSEILKVREGMNLIHILADSQKRQEAEALAGIITGATGLAPLNGVIMFFIMGIWALGEAVLDLRLLLDGNKIPLLKTRDTWNLSLEELLEMGKQGTCPDGRGDEKGLDYTGYLKLLLFTEQAELLYYRLMDVMQMNIRRTQEDFRMKDCIYWAEIEGTASSRHLFFERLLPEYDVLVRTESAY